MRAGQHGFDDDGVHGRFSCVPWTRFAVSIDAAAVIWAKFAQDEQVEARGVVVPFDAIVALLTGRKRRRYLLTLQPPCMPLHDLGDRTIQTDVL